MKKILILIGALCLTTTSFAKGKAKTNTDTKFIKTLETAFEKPIITGDLKLLSGESFIYESFDKKTSPKAKRNFISHYLKLRDVNLIEVEDGVLVIKSRDSLKANIPVFKEEVPNNIREQMITVVRTLPKHLKGKGADRSLRALYSKDGALNVSEDKKKLIISDWTSNAKRIISVIENL